MHMERQLGTGKSDWFDESANADECFSPSGTICYCVQSSGVDVNVIAHKRQHIAVWSGGSILAENVSCPFSLPRY